MQGLQIIFIMGIQKEKGFKGKETQRILDKVEAIVFICSSPGKCGQPHKLASALTSQENHLPYKRSQSSHESSVLRLVVPRKLLVERYPHKGSGTMFYLADLEFLNQQRRVKAPRKSWRLQFSNYSE